VKVRSDEPRISASADGIHWSPAEPLGWQEEHNRLQRLIFWVRRIPHCNDEAHRRLVARLAAEGDGRG
jgi:hypothetical protein